MLEKVDIIITTRNRLIELKWTLDHCLKIGFSGEQIHVVDDGSTDGTYDTLKNSFPTIVLYKNEKSKGYIWNRNFLMQNTSRQYILSLDDDSHIRSAEDIIQAIELMETKPEYGLFTFNAFEQIENPPLKEELPENIRQVRSYIGCGHLINRTVIKELGNYKEEFEFYCEELDYSIRAFKNGYQVMTRDDLVVHHRIDWDQRALQQKDDLNQGVYGAVWRSKLGFSNNLVVTSLYYPLGLDFIFTIYYIGLRAINFLVKKGDFRGFFGGLTRFIKFWPFILKHRQKLSFSQFRHWISLSSK